MKRLFMTTIFTVIYTFHIGNIYAEPQACPSVSAIKAEKFVQGKSKASGCFLENISNYNTNEIWKFVLYIGDVDSENEAFALGNKLLPDLRPLDLTGKPQKDKEGKWFCGYITGTYWGIASTKASNVE